MYLRHEPLHLIDLLWLMRSVVISAIPLLYTAAERSISSVPFLVFSTLYVAMACQCCSIGFMNKVPKLHINMTLFAKDKRVLTVQ